MKNGDYILVKAPDWFKGKRYRKRYCYEHHLVWEKGTGCSVLDGCIIHHKDHNKHNNDFSNLVLMSKEEHTRLHKKPKKVAVCCCPTCGKVFTRDARNLPFRVLNFCSAVCSGKYYNRWHEDKEKIEKDKQNNIIKIILE